MEGLEEGTLDGELLGTWLGHSLGGRDGFADGNLLVENEGSGLLLGVMLGKKLQGIAQLM